MPWLNLREDIASLFARQPHSFAFEDDVHCQRDEYLAIAQALARETLSPAQRKRRKAANNAAYEARHRRVMCAGVGCNNKARPPRTLCGPCRKGE